MKLLLTHGELTKLVQRQLGLAEPVEVVLIESSDEGPELASVAKIRQILADVQREFPKWNYSEKLPAIRRFKQQTSWGLADSKFAIERPHETLRNLSLGLPPRGQ
jgi:hypothetical protein